MGQATRMRDVVLFASPLGPLSLIVDRLLLGRYPERLLGRRNEGIKRGAERR
jgi:hypothetical protein